MNKHLLKHRLIDENQMKNKNKLIGVFIICITGKAQDIVHPKKLRT